MTADHASMEGVTVEKEMHAYPLDSEPHSSPVLDLSFTESSCLSTNQHQSPLSCLSSGLVEVESPIHRHILTTEISVASKLEPSASVPSITPLPLKNNTTNAPTTAYKTTLPRQSIPLSRKYLSRDSKVWEAMLNGVSLALEGLESIDPYTASQLVCPTLFDNTNIDGILREMRFYVLRACQVIYDQHIKTGKSEQASRLATEHGNDLRT